MGKLRYTKEDLENLVFCQLENLNALSEQLELIKKQNELLVKINFELAGKLGQKVKKPLPYPKSNKRVKPY